MIGNPLTRCGINDTVADDDELTVTELLERVEVGLRGIAGKVIQSGFAFGGHFQSSLEATVFGGSGDVFACTRIESKQILLLQFSYRIYQQEERRLTVS